MFKPTDLYSIIYDIANSMPIVVSGGMELKCARLQTASPVKDYAAEIKTNNLGKDPRYTGKKIFFSRSWLNTGADANAISWDYPALFYGEGAEAYHNQRGTYTISYSFALSDRCEQEQTPTLNHDVCASRTYEEVAQGLRDLWQKIYRTLQDYVYAYLYVGTTLVAEGWYSVTALQSLVANNSITSYRAEFYLSQYLGLQSEGRISWDMHTENAVTYFLQMDIMFDNCGDIIMAMPQENIPQPPTFDADAEAYMLAAGIVDTVQQDAVNTLVLELKAANLWNLMYAIYPMLGGTANSHKYNLRNPLDSNAAYRLTFGGGWVHSATGALPNGINAYADTYFEPLAEGAASDIHLSYYSGTNSNGVYIEMGCAGNAGSSGNGQLYIAPSINGTTFRAVNTTGNYSTLTNFNTGGFWGVGRTDATNFRFHKGGAMLYNDSGLPNTASNRNVYIGARNNNGVTDAYSNRECRWASIGAGLSEAEMNSLYTIINNFQTALTRNF